MLRATVWTVGLFGAGTAISRLVPGTWTEPLVLLALGIALLFVSARTARGTARAARSAHGAPMPGVAAQVAASAATAKAPSPVAVAAAAARVQGGTVQVERSA